MGSHLFPVILTRTFLHLSARRSQGTQTEMCQESLLKHISGSLSIHFNGSQSVSCLSAILYIYMVIQNGGKIAVML